MSNTAKLTVREKRKALSTSSSSDSCASPVVSDVNKKKQEHKRQRQESEGDKMAFQTTLDDIVSQLANMPTKDDMRELRDEINKNTARTEVRIEQLESTLFEMQTQRDVLSAEIKLLREENKELRDQVSQCQKDSSSRRREVNDLEQHSRQFNLRVYGVKEAQGGKETVEDCVAHCREIFSKKIGVPVTAQDVDMAHRTGKPGGPRPRPIIVRLHSRRLRSQVLADRRKLKQSGVSVGEDLTQLNYRLLQRASQHSTTLAAWSSNGKILSKVKNGRTVILDLDMNVDAELNRAMNSDDGK